MVTWAMTKRFVFIHERLKTLGRVNRKDIVDTFFVTRQTATATFHAFETRYPGVMTYCSTRKAFVTPDTAAKALVKCSPKVIEFVEMIARCETADEYDERGECMSGDDAYETLSSLIDRARHLTGIRPTPKEPFCSGPCMTQLGSIAWAECPTDRRCNFDDPNRGYRKKPKDPAP